MESDQDFFALRAALEWQVELGATEAISDAPIDRFAVTEPQPETQSKPAAPPHETVATDLAKRPLHAVELAKTQAADAQSLQQLAETLAAFEHCELKRGARNTVFSDGVPDADVMIIGEAPGRDEDISGRPFVGRAGQLLDKMFAAIGRSRTGQNNEESVYITNVMPWRPPQNRDPEAAEIDMMVPFVMRHIALAKPRAIILMGNIACQALLGKKGITRLRGNWEDVQGIPTLPMFHPAYLLRNPAAKKEAWADLLALRAHLAKKP